MNEPETPPSRAERRRRTEERILAEARALFAERGFDRTTIRAVAAEAGVDPALVMQHFGSKQELFRRAALTAYDAVGTGDDGAPGDPDRLLDLLVTMTGVKLAELPETSLPLLRSMLTHQESADHLRAAQAEHVERIAAALPGEDAELRAAMVVALILGVSVERHLIGLPGLHDADPERIAAVMRDCFAALIRG